MNPTKPNNDGRTEGQAQSNEQRSMQAPEAAAKADVQRAEEKTQQARERAEEAHSRCEELKEENERLRARLEEREVQVEKLIVATRRLDHHLSKVANALNKPISGNYETAPIAEDSELPNPEELDHVAPEKSQQTEMKTVDLGEVADQAASDN